MLQRASRAKLTTNQTPWSKVLLQKPIVAQLINKFQCFMEPEGSLVCSQESSTGSHPEPDEFSPHHPTLFLKTRFNIIYPSMARSSK
jgi:hypothetical protein